MPSPDLSPAGRAMASLVGLCLRCSRLRRAGFRYRSLVDSEASGFVDGNIWEQKVIAVAVALY